MKKMLLAAVMAAGLTGTALHAENISLGSATYDFTTVVERQLAPGVTYKYLKAAGRNGTASGYTTCGTHVYLVIADLTEPTVSVEYHTASGNVGGTVASLTDIAQAHHDSNGHRVLAGANANFWITGEKPWASQMFQQPHGTAIHEGETYVQNATGGYGSHIGGPSQTGMIAFTADGKMKINYYQPKLEFLNTRINHVLDIRDFNRTVSTGSAVVYTPAWGRSKAFKPVALNAAGDSWSIVQGQCTEVYLSLAPGETEMKVGGNSTTKYVVKEVKKNAGTGTLGNYDLCIVGQDIEGAPYAAVLANNYQVGDELILTNQFITNGSNWPLVKEATSGNCMTMVAGNVIGSKGGPVDQSTYNNKVYARTIYGTNDDGTKLYIAVCGHKSSNYYGLSTDQLTYILKHFGATYASQVDCGGSSQMYVDGSQVNQSTDGSGLRAVHSGLYIVSSAPEEEKPVSLTEAIYQDYPAVYGYQAPSSYTVEPEYKDREIPELAGKVIKRVIARGDVLYILGLEGKNATVVVYDHVNGRVIRTLGTTQHTTGDCPLADIAISADGWLLGMNWVADQPISGAEQVFQYVWAKDADGIATGEALPANKTKLEGNWNNGTVGGSFAWSGTRSDGMWFYPGRSKEGSTFRVVDLTIKNMQIDASKPYYDRHTYITKAKFGEAYGDADGGLTMFSSPYAENQYIVNGPNNGAILVEGSPASANYASAAPLQTLPVSVIPSVANHTGIFRFGGKIYITSPSYVNSSVNNGILLADITDGLDKAKAVGLGGASLSDYANTNVATTGVGVVTLDESGNYLESRLALFAVRNGAVSKFMTPSSIIIPGEEEHDVYITGAFNGWELPGDQIELNGFSYEYKGFKGGEFKIAIDENVDWKDFDANSIYPTEGGTAINTIEPNKTYDIAQLGADNGNIYVPEGDYTIEISKNLKTLTVSGKEKFVAKKLYLIGEFNGWAEPGVAFDYTDEPVDGNVIYTLSVENLSGEFLIAAAGYNPKYGGANFDNDGACFLTPGGANNKCAGLTNATLTFTLPVEGTQKPMLKIVSEKSAAKDARKPYAHSMGAELVEFGTYTVTFKATGASDEALLVLTDAQGNRYTKSLGAVQGGLNSVDVDLSDLTEGDYTWGINLKGANIGDQPVEVASVKLPVTASTYVGMTVIRDPESEAFGYAVVGMSGQHGYMVFDPNGTLQYGGAIHAPWQASNFKNGDSNTMFGGSYMGYAVFANWNDQAAGYWAVNPLNPNEEPYNMLASSNASMAGSGLWSVNGTKIGGGSTGVAFANLGEETFMVNYDEDYSKGIESYTRRFPTGEKYITVEPSFTITGCDSKFAGFAASDKGFFVALPRSNVADAAVPVLRYYNFNNDLLYTTGDEGNALETSCGSVACNADGSLVAFTSYNKAETYVYSVEYIEPETPQAVRSNGVVRAVEGSQAVPKFTKIATVPTASAGNNPRPDLDFDAAGNLHVADRKAQKYSVYAIPGETQSYTAAPAALALKLQTGIENVKFEAGDNGDVEYYDLQGIRRDAENLTPGLYIRRQGDKATKVIIR